MESSEETRSTGKRGSDRAGSFFTIIFSFVMLYIVDNILEWGWLPFLTDAFNDVIPVINWSLWIDIGLSLVLLALYSPKLKMATVVVANAVSLVVIMRFWEVFPFDFEEWGRGWLEAPVRLVLLVALVGTAISLLVNGVRLFLPASSD